jgi:hypothetical protein
LRASLCASVTLNSLRASVTGGPSIPLDTLRTSISLRARIPRCASVALRTRVPLWSWFSAAGAPCNTERLRAVCLQHLAIGTDRQPLADYAIEYNRVANGSQWIVGWQNL